GADGTGDESSGRTRGRGDGLGGRAGDAHAVGDEATAVLEGDGGPGEAQRARLVTRGGQYAGAGGREVGVHLGEGLGAAADQLGRPQIVVEVDAAVLGRGAQPAGDDDGPGRGEHLRERHGLSEACPVTTDESPAASAPINDRSQFGFEVGTRLDTGGRTGVIRTAHGRIETPAFIPVGTKATVKAVRPDEVAELGGQAVLANAYLLYLQPGSDLIDEAGGLGKFMSWPGPTFADSGGFQVMSLGSGFKKVISMEATGQRSDELVAVGKERLSNVDDDGVTFKSHLDGAMHRFTPEISMRVQHEIGADIMFAFDELTTLINTRGYQEESLERTRQWAIRCVEEHFRLTEARSHRPYQALFGVLQGAQYEDLRRKAARDLGG